MTAVSVTPGMASMPASSVVLPLPRKPVSTEICRRQGRRGELHGQVPQCCLHSTAPSALASRHFTPGDDRSCWCGRRARVPSASAIVRLSIVQAISSDVRSTSCFGAGRTRRSQRWPGCGLHHNLRLPETFSRSSSALSTFCTFGLNRSREAAVSPAVFERLADEGLRMTAQHLAQLSPDRRYAVLAATTIRCGRGCGRRTGLTSDAALVRRGALTVWFTDEAIAAWRAPPTGRRGGQPIYSALAIETALAIRLVFHQPLRQTEGLLRSIADVLGVDIAIPDHTTLSRRGVGLTVRPKDIYRTDPLHLVVDSTGLKIYGEGEWLDAKHGSRSRRRWRKLHIGINADTHEVVVAELMPDDVGDVSTVTELLEQITSRVASLTADGAYDGEAVYHAVAERHPGAAVIIPPRATAIANEAATS